jgi:hypothetical protein
MERNFHGLQIVPIIELTKFLRSAKTRCGPSHSSKAGVLGRTVCLFHNKGKNFLHVH